MIFTTVHVWVKPEHVEDFIKATKANHEGSTSEPGNLRFDVIQDLADASRFILYEVFESKDAIEEHKKTPHYLKWKTEVEPWMARPREGVPHSPVYPKDRSAW
ncbi:MAG: antibiotic biosynthesis monooxygenase [Elusimicrobiota bacterium]